MTSLIRTESLRLLNIPPTDSFPFQRLPKELRLKVLEESDLVPEKRFFGSYGIFKFATLVWRRRLCYAKCNYSSEACCCIWRCGSFSLTCDCPSSPMAYFLVNRQLYNEAQEVFFPSNLFIIQALLYQLMFFNLLPPHQLSRLRCIQIEVSKTELIDWWTDQATHGRFSQLVRIIQRKLNLPHLELRVNVNKCHLPGPLSTSEYKRSRRMITAFLDPLSKLRSLKKLFLYLEGLSHLEESLEKKIMGPDYDSARLGKPAEHD